MSPGRHTATDSRDTLLATLKAHERREEENSRRKEVTKNNCATLSATTTFLFSPELKMCGGKGSDAAAAAFLCIYSSSLLYLFWYRLGRPVRLLRFVAAAVVWNPTMDSEAFY